MPAPVAPLPSQLTRRCSARSRVPGTDTSSRRSRTVATSVMSTGRDVSLPPDVAAHTIPPAASTATTTPMTIHFRTDGLPVPD